jgi:hypothetical protein
MALPFETINIFTLAAGIVFLSIIVIYQERRLSKILRGGKSENLEQTLSIIKKEYDKTNDFIKKTFAGMENLDTRIKKSITGTELVKFNAWKGTGEGGQQSFAGAFLDEEGNGIVLSSLYSRERVSIFAKTIKNGKSDVELTLEEKEAVSKAWAKAKK